MDRVGFLVEFGLYYLSAPCYLIDLKISRVVSCSSLVELQMCMEGRRHLYWGRRFRWYLLWLVLSQNVRKKTLIFCSIEVSIFFGRRHDSCNSQRCTRNSLRRNASCWGQSLVIQFPFSYSNQLFHPAWHFGSRISPFSCSIFSFRHVLIRLGFRRSYWQCYGWHFDRIYTVRILSCSPFFFTSLNLFDPEKPGAPHSTY